MEREPLYTVCTRCFTYNQASYILDALNGFVAQQTDFPVVYTIVDDASTDGEPEILRDYFKRFFNVDDSIVAYQEKMDFGTILFAQHKVNKNCYFAILLLEENHYRKKKSKSPYLSRWENNAKYMALCEGDDYWTDPTKLQRQVGFMDSHSEIGLCYTDYNHLDQVTHSLTMSMFELQHKYHTTSYEQFLLKPGYLAPMTWLYRNELSHLIVNSTVFSDGTYAYMLEFMYNSRVSYLPVTTATYRSHPGSASSPTNVKGTWLFFKGVFDTQLSYSSRYLCPEDLRQKVKIQGYLRWLPIAIMADQHVFVEEARTFFESLDMDISLIISELKEGEKMKTSYAYRIGKILMAPFSFLRRRIVK